MTVRLLVLGGLGLLTALTQQCILAYFSTGNNLFKIQF